MSLAYESRRFSAQARQYPVKILSLIYVGQCEWFSVSDEMNKSLVPSVSFINK